MKKGCLIPLVLIILISIGIFYRVRTLGPKVKKTPKEIISAKDDRSNDDWIIDLTKRNLIGDSIPGWRFKSLFEFKNIEIIDRAISTYRNEYHLKLVLVNEKGTLNDAEIKVAYDIKDRTWTYLGVTPIYLYNSEKMSYPNLKQNPYPKDHPKYHDWKDDSIIYRRSH